jgi:hypothetical protein
MAATMTVTEALAELKTITKRLEKKRVSLTPYLWRQEGLKDPMEKDGGSVEFIKRERQAIVDLETRFVAIRTAIQKKNLETSLTVGDDTRNIQEWLNWRKEIAVARGTFLASLYANIQATRKSAQTKGYNVVQATAEGEKQSLDILINVDEAELLKLIEEHENILGTLDGQLSLKVATATIEV